MSREAGRGTGDVVSAAATTGAGVGVATGFGGVAQATDMATAVATDATRHPLPATRSVVAITVHLP